MQINNRARASTPATTTHLSAQALSDPPIAKLQQPLIPAKEEIAIRILTHVLMLGLCILSLVELWKRAPRGLFVAFLIWTVSFYIILVILAWYGRPRYSTLTVLLCNIRGTGQSTSACAHCNAKRVPSDLHGWHRPIPGAPQSLSPPAIILPGWGGRSTLIIVRWPTV